MAEPLNHIASEMYNFVLTLSIAGLGVATMDGMLYAAGGHSGAAYLDRMECYNPYEDKWTVMKPMLNSRCNFAFAGL